MLNKQNKFKQQGFTLMEILIVVVILSILAVAVVPQFMDKPDEARVARAKSDIQSLNTALSIYKMDNFQYPSSAQGLQALVQKPAGSPEAKNWNPNGYLQKLPQDPWGNDYQYLNPGSRAAIDIYSFGRDGQPGGDGVDADIGNW